MTGCSQILGHLVGTRLADDAARGDGGLRNRGSSTSSQDQTYSYREILHVFHGFSP